SFAVPLFRLRVVSEGAFAFVVHPAESVGGVGDSLLGGFQEPFRGLLWIRGNTLAIGVHDSKVVLRGGDALFGGFLVPFRGLLVILRYALAARAEKAEIVLGVGIAGSRDWLPLG